MNREEIILLTIMGAVFFIMWTLIFFMSMLAFKAKEMKDFMMPAGLALIGATFFMGPLCLIVWFSMVLKMVTLRK